jgi:hypothetical protein
MFLDRNREQPISRNLTKIAVVQQLPLQAKSQRPAAEGRQRGAHVSQYIDKTVS